MKIIGIYKIQSISHPDRIYIGSALSLINRESAHRTALLRGKHENELLQNHYNKYGKDDLAFEILESGEYLCKQHLLSREQGWMYHFAYGDTWKPYFNIVPIAGSCQGRILSEETKAKIGLKSKNLSKEIREIIRIKLTGRKVSDETIEKISSTQKGRQAWNKGKKMPPSWNKGITGYKLNLTEEQRQKRRENATGNENWVGRTHSEETKKKQHEAAIGKPKAKEHVDSMTVAQRERRLKEKQDKSLINI